ncbi:hypothetical protein [Spirosoma fluminis]
MVSLKCAPYNTGWIYPTPDQNRFHLSLLAHEYRQTTTSLFGRFVQILVTTVPGLAYNTRLARIDVLETDQSVDKRISQGNYQPGYTFVAADRVLEVTGISVQGDQLTLLDKGPVTPSR